jgi:hypothetical protein
MTSEEFHGLVEECSYDFDGVQRDAPLTLSRLAQLERHKGIRFPAFYKEFLSMYGPGDFGCVTVLSPDPKSGFSIWETTSRLENRECNFIGVVESIRQSNPLSGRDVFFLMQCRHDGNRRSWRSEAAKPPRGQTAGGGNSKQWTAAERILSQS